jgi:putative glutamine amidotransferase
MMKIPLGFLLAVSIPLLFSFSPGNEKPLKIALSKGAPNYSDWLHRGDSSIVIVDLGGLTPPEAIKKLQECAGLVLTGGGDINPSEYNNASEKEFCTDIDLNRDRLEKALIAEALKLKMPVLGICRGEQMLNVYSRGYLISDIPNYKKRKAEEANSSAKEINTGAEQPVPLDFGIRRDPSEVIHRCEDYLHCYHTVRLDSTSLLRRMLGSDTGFVTTNHHQSVLKPGMDMKANAQTADGIIEGIEWKNPEGKSFMIGVQWHPERMDTANAFSGKLLQRFVSETRSYALTPGKLK